MANDIVNESNIMSLNEARKNMEIRLTNLEKLIAQLQTNMVLLTQQVQQQQQIINILHASSKGTGPSKL